MTGKADWIKDVRRSKSFFSPAYTKVKANSTGLLFINWMQFQWLEGYIITLVINTSFIFML